MASYTPSSSWPVIGHDWAVDLLHRTLVSGRIPHALLVTGPPNIGKETLALTFTQALLCTQDQRPCGGCRACRLVATRSHPDLRWVEPQTSSLKVDQVRELTRQLALAPLEGSWQVAILDRFESATPGAANALLKTLEEPPPTVILVLLAQRAEALLPTIVSRCQVVALRPIPHPVVEQALIERWQVDVKQAELLSHICGGRLGWAVSAAKTTTVLERREQKLDDLATLLHSKRVARFTYAASLARQSPESIQESLELWTGWWRDVLLLNSHSSVPLTNVDRRTELVQTAKQCDVTTTRETLSTLQNTMEQLAHNANVRLALEVLLLTLPFLP